MSDTGPDTGGGCTAVSGKSAPSIISDTGSGWTDYTGKVRKTENLMMARIGDSVVVRYLPDDPDVHRLVRSEDSKYRVIRPRPRSRARRSAS